MADPAGKSWSDNPNAPKIPYWLYFWEKAVFAGLLTGAIFYGAFAGIVVVLFFQCMGALFNPANRTKGGIRWGLVAHTVAMFSFVTISTALNLDIQSFSYIDNREFPGNGGIPPGPLGYQFLIYSKAISVVPSIMFILNQWLADGLLLYRCYVIYSMNYWVVVFPCLMYLASLALGILYTYVNSRPGSGVWDSVAVNIGLAYFSISPSLNILLTLMIVIRLALHSRNFRNAIGAPHSTSGLYNAVVTMLVESCALYAVNSILYIGPWGAGNHIADIFFPILSETQVIAPFLVVLRVANRSALTNNSIVSGNLNLGSIRFGGQGKSTDANRTLSDGFPVSSMEMNAETSGELGVRVETIVDEVPSRQG